MNMFEKAKAAPVKAPKAAKAKKDKLEVNIPGMESYAAVCAVFKAVEALKKTMEPEVKGHINVAFRDAGMETKRRPENFKGVEGEAEASCELRLRSSRSPLRSDETELLDEHNIPYGTNDQVVETYIINPAYAENQDILAKVSKALGRVAGLPADFIQHQSEKTSVATEESINEVFKLDDPAVVSTLLALVTTTAIKPKLVGTDADKRAFEIVEKLLSSQDLPNCAEEA